MLKEIEFDLKNLSKNIQINMNQKSWQGAINEYKKLSEKFTKNNLNLQAILALVSIAVLQEKRGQIEEAGKIIFDAAEKFKSIKQNGYALRAYQRALSFMEFLNKKEEIELIKEKIESIGTLDLVIVADSTGSMGSALTAIKQEIAKMLYLLSDNVPGARIGALTYRDHCDEARSYLIRTHPFIEPTDYKKLITFIKGWNSGGGGDVPEALEDALSYLQNGYEWESSRKMAILIADAPPNDPSNCPKGLDWREETKKLADDDIKVYTVLSGLDANAEKDFKEIAELTQAEFFKLNNTSDLPDLIVAIALSSMHLVEDFIIDLESRGQLSESKKIMLEKLLR
ncbi:MAG: VWA domain-containing protein [Promethearchaeota archaeon]